MQIHKNYYNLTAYEEMFHIELVSCWDERMMEQGLKDCVSLVSIALAGTDWCALVDSRKWELCTPQVAQILIKALKNCPEVPSHLANVVGESQLKEWQLSKIYKNTKQMQAQFFTTVQEAMDWLESMGYAIPQIMPDVKRSEKERK